MMMMKPYQYHFNLQSIALLKVVFLETVVEKLVSNFMTLANNSLRSGGENIVNLSAVMSDKVYIFILLK